MKLKQGLLRVVTVILIAAACTACAPAPAEEPEWSITVEGADKTTFTSLDYAELEEVQIEVTNKDQSTSAWEGVQLSDVLDYLGAAEFSSVTVTASDGYAQDYTPEIANEEMTILGTKLDDSALTADDGFVAAIAGNQPPRMTVRMLVKITVNK